MRRLKYFIVLLLLIFVVFMAASGWRALSPKPPADQTLSVLTYNIGSAPSLEPDTDEIAEVIQWNIVDDLDIILVQDSPWKVKMKDLAKSLGFAHYLSGRDMSHKNNSGILSRLPLKNPKSIRLPSKYPRPGALCAEVEFADKTILVCSIHLSTLTFELNKMVSEGEAYFSSVVSLMYDEAFRETEHSRGIDKLFTWIDTKQYDAIIIGGDFNTFLFSKTIRAMTARFEDALWPSPDYFCGTYTRFDFPVKPRIDYIFHSREVKCLDAEIIPLTAGDHYPIRAVFDLP